MKRNSHASLHPRPNTSQPPDPSLLFAEAFRAHQAGQSLAAEEGYRRLLAVQPAHADGWHLLGLIHHQRGQYAEALHCMRKAIALQQAAPYFNNLGLVLEKLEQWEDAEKTYQQALALRPDYANARYNLGLLLQKRERLAEALASYRQVLAIEPHHLDALNNMGNVCKALQDYPAALACYHQALALKPDYFEARINLGNTLLKQGQWDDAIDCFRWAQLLRPNHPAGPLYLGLALKEKGQWAEAVASLQQALVLNSHDPTAWTSLGVVWQEQGNLLEAVSCYRKALASQPGFAEAVANLGTALQEQGALAEALACIRQALTLNPRHAAYHGYLGAALQEQGALDEALTCYRRSQALDPSHADAHGHESLLLLLQGRFQEGWEKYEWRWHTKAMANHERIPLPLWDGSDPAGRTLLLHAEQGLGDTLHFVRYARLVQARGAKVVLQCQPPLARLLVSVTGIDHLLSQGQPIPPCAGQVPLLSLPRLFHTDLATIPSEVPYIQPPAHEVDHWRQKLSAWSGLKVGLVWRGSAAHRNDRNRSLPARALAPLLAVAGVTFFGLVKEPLSGEIALLSQYDRFVDLGPALDDFMDTSAILAALDLLITVDTAVAHLAGAMARPTWLLLPFVPDWRWLLAREDSPWYPTLRIFRQTRSGDWTEVLQRVEKHLRELSADP